LLIYSFIHSFINENESKQEQEEEEEYGEFIHLFFLLIVSSLVAFWLTLPVAYACL